MHPELLSTEVTDFTPLDIISRLILPVPEHRSRQFNSEKSKRLSRILNNPVLAKSVVGRTGRFPGGLIMRPLYFPLIMRKLTD